MLILILLQAVGNESAFKHGSVKFAGYSLMEDTDPSRTLVQVYSNTTATGLLQAVLDLWESGTSN